MNTHADMPLPTVIEQIVSPEPNTRDDFIDDLQGPLAEPDRTAGEPVHRPRAIPAHDRAPAHLHRGLVE
jgi:hypothetical protein